MSERTLIGSSGPERTRAVSAPGDRVRSTTAAGKGAVNWAELDHLETFDDAHGLAKYRTPGMGLARFRSRSIRVPARWSARPG